jgi:small-conductance mechanosensitive channel/CRP-like cAMP-binding protein
MSFVDALITEALEASTPLALLFLVGVLVLSRALPGAGHKRLPSSVGLLGIHVVLLFVTAGLMAAGSEGAREARIAARVVLAMAWVGTGGALVFGVAMSRSRLKISRILQDLIVGGVTLTVVLAVLHKLGVSLGGLFATSAVVTAVIGLSLQDTLGNTIGGLALQADGSVQIGDWVRIGEVNGRVSEIRWRYTAIETRNWETVLIPNSVLMKGPVTVLGRRHGAVQQWRRWVWFNVDFRFAPSDVIEHVNKALRNQPLERVSQAPPPDCVLMDLHESYGRYAARYWLTDLAVDDPTDSVVRTRIVFALKRAGIPLSIPAHAIFLTEESKKRKELKTLSERQLRIDALRQVDLFAPLDDEELEKLAEALHPSPFTRGEIITRQGAEAHWLYLVIEGEVSVRVAKDGAEHEVARMANGSFFGEMSLITGEPRSATVVALTDVDCYRLDREAFQELVQRRPEVAKPIAELLAERRARRALVEENLSADARARKLKEDENDLLSRMKSFFRLE